MPGTRQVDANPVQRAGFDAHETGNEERLRTWRHGGAQDGTAMRPWPPRGDAYPQGRCTAFALAWRTGWGHIKVGGVMDETVELKGEASMDTSMPGCATS